MIARIKAAILIVYGFSLVMLAYKGAVDIAQDLLGDRLSEEALDAISGTRHALRAAATLRPSTP
jgi:uncharacterized membrane protein (Fun14 family)